MKLLPYLIPMALAASAFAQSTFTSSLPFSNAKQALQYYPGVNLAAAEFGKEGELGKKYVYPNDKEFQYFAGKGFKIVRIPFKWERVQPELRGEFDPANIAEIDRCVTQANAAGLVVLLDVHNYGGRKVPGQEKGVAIGMDPALTKEDFNDLWVRFSNRYKGNPMVWFGLMNEPHKVPAKINAENMQAVVNAIRATGATNKILVPGTSYTGAHSWIKSGNAESFNNFKDSGNNFAFEVHQYLDKDSSGTHPQSVPGAGTKTMAAFTAWAKQHHYKAFLGEFGWAIDPASQKEGDDILSFMDRNKDVFIGYSYWAAGPWWPGTYMYTVEPEGLKVGTPVDRPQMSVLTKHLK